MRLLTLIRRLITGYKPEDYSVGKPIDKKIDCWLCRKRASAIFRVADRNVAVCQDHDPRLRNPGEDWHYMWEIAPDEDTLREMQHYGCKFAAYQNGDHLDEGRGQLRFLRYGYLNNSYAVPPEAFPEQDGSRAGKYKRIGYVNLGKGTIHSREEDAKVEGNPYGSGEDERLLQPTSSARLWVR